MSLINVDIHYCSEFKVDCIITGSLHIIKERRWFKKNFEKIYKGTVKEDAQTILEVRCNMIKIPGYFNKKERSVTYVDK